MDAIQKAKMIQELLSRAKAEDNFYEFVRQAWHLVEGDNPFIDGWHLHAICEHLEAVVNRDIRNLLINMPPRSGKSSLVSVLFPAWVWVKRPEERFLYASYSHKLAIRDNIRCKRVIESDWYRQRWGENFQLLEDQNNSIRYDNSKSGFRLVVSQKAGTGDGGSISICDDPNSARDAVSELDREARIMWFESIWSTRGNNPKTDCKIVVQQRVHERDISGSILANDEKNVWTKLILPMEFSSARRSKTIILPSTNGKVWQDPREKDGDLLWPERIGPEELEKIKNGLGNQYRISGQLNQNPSPDVGGIIKKAWFKWWKYAEPPQILHTIMSIDTALDSNVDAENAYSAVTTWGLFEDDHKVMNVILLAMWRGKLEYPDLRKFIQRLHRDYTDDKFNDPKIPPGHNKPDVVLIEDKATGLALIRDLHRAGVLATKFNPNRFGDKITRVRICSHLIEAGRVWVPAKPPHFKHLRTYADELVEHCAAFPIGESRDIVDTVVQMLLRLQSGGYLTSPHDDLFQEVSRSSYNGRANTRAYY